MSRAKTFVDDKISGKKVVVFSKTTCGFCARVKDLLRGYNLTSEEYEVVELNQGEDMAARQDYLLKLTGARSVPRVFVNGKSIGGCDDTFAAHKNKQLEKLLAA